MAVSISASERLRLRPAADPAVLGSFCSFGEAPEGIGFVPAFCADAIRVRDRGPRKRGRDHRGHLFSL